MRFAIVLSAVCLFASAALSRTLNERGFALQVPEVFGELNATSCSDAPACATKMACFHGVCAYSNGADQCTGNSCDGYGTWGYKFQCVELAQRFFNVKHGIKAIWYDNANEMCSKYPAGVSTTSSPKPGDLMVFGWAPYGHVTVITDVAGSKVHVIEQNSSPTGRNVYDMGSQLCFLTA